MIRTGTGDITIDAGGSVYLMNQMATIYTAGQLSPDSSTLAGFNSPTESGNATYDQTLIYGRGFIAPATQYTAQYTENGGNIVINAQQDIEHVTKKTTGTVTTYVADTSWQFPTNWLYRRGATSSAGVFDVNAADSSEVTSTTWWVDFSNFFEGIGALGGGNVSLNAGDDIINVDAVVPTNARMTYVPVTNSSGDLIGGTPGPLLELGGGDLSVIAGGTIEGGAYYVEKGEGLIEAATISTPASDTARISAEDTALGQTTPLPLTLFVGGTSDFNSFFTVEATNGITLGSTVNPFLLPQGINNGFDDNGVFSTYGAGSGVSVSSLLGDITIQGSEAVGSNLPGSLYNAYFSNASPGNVGKLTVEKSRNKTPWTLTLEPTSGNNDDLVTEYGNFYNYSPPIFKATAFSGNINYSSDQRLAASQKGTLSLLAAGKVEGAFLFDGDEESATISVLDNDPSLFPGVTNPLGFGAALSNSPTLEPFGFPSLVNFISQVYDTIEEAPSYSTLPFTSLQSQHTAGLLHDNDTTPPVQIETVSGDIEDFTLISPEKTDISSGQDLLDVSLYIQNNNANDVSIVSANRDIILYDSDCAGPERRHGRRNLWRLTNQRSGRSGSAGRWQSQSGPGHRPC